MACRCVSGALFSKFEDGTHRQRCRDGWNTIFSFEKGLQEVFHEPLTGATFLVIIYRIHFFWGAPSFQSGGSGLGMIRPIHFPGPLQIGNEKASRVKTTVGAFLGQFG